jgi:hypothetical protein
MNSSNKPNLVPADIKHGKTTHLVGTRKNTFQLCEVAESCMLQNSVPGIQGGGTFRVLFGKIQYFFPCYDVHVFLISQYEICVKHVIQNNAIFRFYGSGVFKGSPILCHVLEWNLILHRNLIAKTMPIGIRLSHDQVSNMFSLSFYYATVCMKDKIPWLKLYEQDQDDFLVL